MTSIIHFTDKFQTLKSILSELSFRLHYCRETFYLGEAISSAAVHPMVSFSEQLVSKLDKKRITYGRFAIALKKGWVKGKHIHPVLYIDCNSHVAKALSDLLKARRIRPRSELGANVRLAIMTIKCFTKNTEGYNSYFKKDNFNFKGEREWRYVPTKSQINNQLISLGKKKYEACPDEHNKKLAQYPLRFHLTDIQYVFVRTDKQRDFLTNHLGIDRQIIKIGKWET